MFPTPSNYTVRPVIYPADVECEVTILPSERAFLLLEGEEYTVSLLGVFDDVLDYRTPSAWNAQTVTAHGGVLRFS